MEFTYVAVLWMWSFSLSGFASEPISVSATGQADCIPVREGVQREAAAVGQDPVQRLYRDSHGELKHSSGHKCFMVTKLFGWILRLLWRF